MDYRAGQAALVRPLNYRRVLGDVRVPYRLYRRRQPGEQLDNGVVYVVPGGTLGMNREVRHFSGSASARRLVELRRRAVAARTIRLHMQSLRARIASRIRARAHRAHQQSLFRFRR